MLATEWLQADAASFECFDVLEPKVHFEGWVGFAHC
jgi:hypothetical protein